MRRNAFPLNFPAADDRRSRNAIATATRKTGEPLSRDSQPSSSSPPPCPSLAGRASPLREICTSSPSFVLLQPLCVYILAGGIQRRSTVLPAPRARARVAIYSLFNRVVSSISRNFRDSRRRAPGVTLPRSLIPSPEVSSISLLRRRLRLIKTHGGARPLVFRRSHRD